MIVSLKQGADPARVTGELAARIEVHDDPGRAKSDGPQALPLAEARALVAELTALSGALSGMLGGAGRTGEGETGGSSRRGAGR